MARELEGPVDKMAQLIHDTRIIKAWGKKTSIPMYRPRIEQMNTEPTAAEDLAYASAEAVFKAKAWEG